MFHRQVHAVEVAALDVVVAGPQRPDREHDRVVLLAQLFDGQVDADLAVGDETRSLGPHLGEPLIQRRLLQLVLRDAVAHQPAESVVALVHRDVMAGAGELLRRSQSRGSGADDGDALARRDGGRLRLDDAVHPGLVDDGLFDALDGDAAAGLLLGDRQHARGLARCRAQPAGELGEVVGGVQPVAGGVPPAPPHQVVPFGNEVAQRTARSPRVAERDSAVHAAARLLRHLAGALVRVLPLVDLAPVADTLVDGALGRLDLGHLEEPVRISHGWPP